MEIRKVLELIDVAKIKEISREYFENDPSVQELVRYIHSDEFLRAKEKFMTSSEVEDIIAWMKQQGVDIDREALNFSHEVNEITPMHIRGRQLQPFSIVTFHDELMAQVRLTEMNKLIDELLVKGFDLTQLYLILRVSRPALERLFQEEEISQAVEKFATLGIDVDDIKTTLYELFRWN